MPYDVRIQYEEEAPTRAIARDIVMRALRQAPDNTKLESHIGQLSSGGYVVSLTHIAIVPTATAAQRMTQNARMLFGIDNATSFETSAEIAPYTQESASGTISGGYEDVKPPEYNRPHGSGGGAGLPKPVRPRIKV